MEEAQDAEALGSANPLFVHEQSPPPPYLHASVPVPSIAESDLPSVAQTEPLPEDPVIHAIQALKNLETEAKAEIATWSPIYLGHADDIAAPAVKTGAKRKASEMEDEASNIDTEGESDSDDDDPVPAYDPNKQERPKLPIYHPGFSLTEKIAQGTLKIFDSYITTCMSNGYDDDEAKILRKELLSYKTVPYQEAIRLAVAGDTGAGKSALLNATLGVLNLNIESDSGGACTCVITEFKQAPPTQKKSFAAEVHFFSLAMCEKIVTDLFAQWFKVKQKQRRSPDEVGDEDLSQIKTARDCLQQLFADRLGTESAERFMGDATSANDPIIRKKLIKWTTDIYQQFIPEGQTFVEFEASTPEKLIEQYHPFTREVSNASFRGQPLRFTPWPLVRLIRVNLKSPILEQNVVIADVPGGSDTNLTRMDNATRYLQGCDVTIVVAKIDRLQDNTSFQTHYMDAFRRRRSGSVILVATRSDDVNDDGESTLMLNLQTEDLLAEIAQKISDIEQLIVNVNVEIDRNKTDGKPNIENKPLRKKKKKLTARRNTLGKRRRDILIASRNKQVTDVVSENFRQDTGDDAGAAMYCVSNRMYMRHLRGYDKTDEKKAPTMTLGETQIPAFCSHIYVLPSKGRTAELDHFVRVSIPMVLSIMQVSCSTTTIARSKHLVSIIRKAREALRSRLSELAAKFCSADIKTLGGQLSHPDLQNKFDNNAVKKLGEWESLNAATHRAVCNKRGTHSQKKKLIFMNWNRDLMEPIKSSIDTAFHTLIDESCATFQAESAQAAKEIIGELDHKLKNDPQALACDAYSGCFKENLVLFDNVIDKHVTAATKNLKERLVKIHVKSVRLTPEDFFPQAMENIYKEAYAKKAKGRGITMKIARCTYLMQSIPVPTGPFSEIAPQALKATEAAIETSSEELKTSLDDILRKVQVAFERMKKKDNDTPQGKMFRDGLHKLIAESRDVLNGVASESLELCKGFE